MTEHIFKLPDLGEGITEAEIVEWHVKPGDVVKEDHTVVDVMTDKATVEIPAPFDATVVRITGEPGDILAVGSELLVFSRDGAAPAKTEPKPTEAPAAEKPSPAPAAAPAPATAKAAPAAAATSVVSERPLTSPSIRRKASEAGVDLRGVPGSGPKGRITRDDFDAFVKGGGRLAAASGKAKRPGVEQIKLIGLRRKIAEKMAESKRSIPHFTYVDEVDVTELDALRKHLNETRRDDQPKLTMLPFFMQALVKVLEEFPEANCTFDSEAGIITRYDAAHIGIATQTSNGLMVPVVKHAEALDIWQCASEVARVSTAARDGKAKMDELTGSSITITSLGPIGGIVTTPVINHPEVGIIGINKIAERVVPINGTFTVRSIMNLSCSFDHRVVDGYVAAQLVQCMRAYLEHPATIFI